VKKDSAGQQRIPVIPLIQAQAQSDRVPNHIVSLRSFKPMVVLWELLRERFFEAIVAGGGIYEQVGQYS
jgi:hypothetical protein